MYCYLFFFNDTATTEIYTLSLHDALPIFTHDRVAVAVGVGYAHERDRIAQRCGNDGEESPGEVERQEQGECATRHPLQDRKSTRLNSSHANISYAVFCLKKKKPHPIHNPV